MLPARFQIAGGMSERSADDQLPGDGNAGPSARTQGAARSDQQSGSRRPVQRSRPSCGGTGRQLPANYPKPASGYRTHKPSGRQPSPARSLIGRSRLIRKARQSRSPARIAAQAHIRAPSMMTV
jgi:hypothetical protein